MTVNEDAELKRDGGGGQYNVIDYTQDSYFYSSRSSGRRQTDFPFSLGSFGYFETFPHYVCSREEGARRDWLILITVGGEGFLRRGKTETLLTPGTAVVFDTSQAHEYRYSAGDKWKFFFAHFWSETMKAYSELTEPRAVPVRVRSVDHVTELMRQFKVRSSDDIVAAAVNSNILSGILTDLLCSMVESNESGFRQARKDIDQLAHYIHVHCAESLTLDDYCRISSLSRYHLIRIFHAQIGTTPHQYMHRCRIDKARVMLQTLDFSIAKIAAEVGYANQTVFTRHFRAFTGETPSEYRAMLSRNKNEEGSGSW